MASFAPVDRDIRLYAQVKRESTPLSKTRSVVVRYPFEFKDVCAAILKTHSGGVASDLDTNDYKLLHPSGLPIEKEFVPMLENDSKVVLVEAQAQFAAVTPTNKRTRSVSGQLFTVRKLFQQGTINEEEKAALKDMLISGDKNLESACEAYYDGGDTSAIRKILDAHLSSSRPRINSVEDAIGGVLTRGLRSTSIDMTNPRDRGHSLGIDPMLSQFRQQSRHAASDSVGSFSGIGSFGFGSFSEVGRKRLSSNFSMKSRSMSDQFFEDLCEEIAENLAPEDVSAADPNVVDEFSMGKPMVTKRGSGKGGILSDIDETFFDPENGSKFRGQSGGNLFDFDGIDGDTAEWDTNDLDLDLDYAEENMEEAANLAPPEKRKAVAEYIGGLTKEERRAKIDRWLEKRKKRNWSKNKTHYKPRQAFAKQRVRIKGRFVKIDHPLHPDNPINVAKRKAEAAAAAASGKS